MVSTKKGAGEGTEAKVATKEEVSSSEPPKHPPTATGSSFRPFPDGGQYPPQLIKDLEAYLAASLIETETFATLGAAESPVMRSRLEEQLRPVGPAFAKKFIETHGPENIFIENSVDKLYRPNEREQLFRIMSSINFSLPKDKQPDNFHELRMKDLIPTKVLKQIISDVYGPEALKSSSIVSLETSPEPVPISVIPRLFPGLKGVERVAEMLYTGMYELSGIPFESSYLAVIITTTPHAFISNAPGMHGYQRDGKLVIAKMLEAFYSAYPEKVPPKIFSGRPRANLSQNELNSLVGQLRHAKDTLRELPARIVNDVAAKLKIQNPQEYVKLYHAALERMMFSFEKYVEPIRISNPTRT